MAVAIGCGVQQQRLGYDVDPVEAPPDGGSSEAAPPPDFGFSDAATPIDAAPSVTEGCRIATIGSPGAHPSDIFATWLDTTGAKSSASLKDQVLTAALLSPYKMIVAQDVSNGHAYTPAEVTVLEEWIEAGGGFMALNGFTGVPSEPVNANRLLAPYGMSFGSKLILFTPATIPITIWPVAHPVSNGISSIGWGYGYEVLGAGTSLAGEGGYEVLKVNDVGAGHVVLWGDEWIMYNTEWSTNPQYQVKQLWQNIVDWFDPGAGCKVPDPLPPK